MENQNTQPIETVFSSTAMQICSLVLLVGLGCLVGYHTLNSYLDAYLFFYPLAYVAAFFLSPYSYQRTFTLATLALVVRFFASYVTPLFVVFDDEVGYAWIATEVSSALNSAASDPWSYYPWPNISGFLYYLFGASPHVVKALNSCLGVVTGFMLCRVAGQLYHDPRVTGSTLYLGLFLPPIVFLSSIALKEQLIAFLLVLILFGVTEQRWGGWTLATVGVLLLAKFRFDFALGAVGLVGIYSVVGLVSHRRLPWLLKPMILVLSVGVLIGFLAVALQLEAVQGSKMFQVLSGEDKRGIAQMRQSQAQFVEYLDVENPFAWENLLLAPIRSVYSPSPLRPLKSPSFEVLFEALALTLCWYIAFPYALLGMVASGSNTDRWFAIGVFWVVFLSASYTVLTFAPETFRYRWSALPIFFMLAAYGWFYGKKPLRGRILSVWWASATVFSGVYFL
ncbi:MAG: hypothetical protein ACREQA_01645 [Candidatus Binatia bacterium]